MATIPNQGTGLRHVRKTINFDGGANNGNLGDEVPVFTTTGRVLVEKGFVYCSDALVSSAPDETNIALFTGGAILGLDPVLLTGVATGLWLTQDINGWDYWGRDIGQGFGQPAISTNITLKVDQDVTGADITDGTLIIDIWYYPVSDDGALAGDDIDTSLEATINAQVLDVIDTDTFAEPGQGNPGATITLAAKIGYLYKAWRNRHTVTDSEYALYADNGTTKDQEAIVSDDDTTFERGEITTGA